VTEDRPISAARLAELLGDDLPSAADVSPEALDLVERVRDLVEAVVVTDLPAAERTAITAEVAALSEQLRAVRRDDVLIIARGEHGGLENLTQAASGRLNPQAPRVEFDTVEQIGSESEPVAVEIRARCTLTAAHSGPPGRAHGGVVALLLDQVIGVAAAVAGATGLTAGLNVRFRDGTPLDTPLEITARWTGVEGRKSFAAGELRADGVVLAEATGIFIRERRDDE
jgi:acyl-coenzyme A thioesterase PaaI-like protein